MSEAIEITVDAFRIGRGGSISKDHAIRLRCTWLRLLAMKRCARLALEAQRSPLVLRPRP